MVLLLVACSAEYPTAEVTAAEDSPVAVASELAAYVTESPESGDGDGAAWVIMTEEQLGCAEVTAMPEAVRDAAWLMYVQQGLAVYLEFDTVDDATTYLDWEETYWGGEAQSPQGTRWMQAFAFGGGQRWELAGGWFSVERRRVDEFEGSFAVPYYDGTLEADPCGAWDVGPVDTAGP